MAGKPFWEQPLSTLTREQWEALCDGCGKCCLHKVEDEDSGAIYNTNVACKLLDLKTARCADYANRRSQVPDCVRLTPRSLRDIPWLPATCAYRLRADGLPLPGWHYLISGDPQAVHAAGVSVVGKAISETIAGPIENHIVWVDPADAEDDQDHSRPPFGFSLR
ncbi:MAG: YcgN family cysteine cluster protein [Sphingomonadales bacterium]|nr:YcgN family cysteine cluster protein [Sphingomonadales bacterium]